MIVVERVERDALRETSDQAAASRLRVTEDEGTLVAARTEAMGVEERVDACSQAAFRADNEVNAIAAELTRSRDHLAHLDQRLRSAADEKDQIALRLAQLGSERDDLEARKRSLEADFEERQADAQTEEQALTELKAEEAGAEQIAERARQEVTDATTSSVALRAQLEACQRRISETRTREERMLADRERTSEELANMGAHEAAIRRSVAERAEGKRHSAEELTQLERELEALRPRSLESERELDTAKNELGLKRNRLRALEDIHRRLEGVGTGVRALLSSGDGAVLGMVAEHLEVDEEHTAALAGLLGERLQCVIVSEPERGLALLDTLRSTGRGRATIAPQSPRYVAGSRRAPLPGGIALGYLLDSVRYAPEHEALVRSLIGDAVLCRTAEDALELARRVPGSTAVALDGTVAHADGLVSGGSSDDVASAMVEQKREIRQLTDEVFRLEHRVHDAAEERRAIRTRMTELGTMLDRARAGALENEIAHVSAEKDLVHTLGEIDRATQRLAALHVELDELRQSLDDSIAEETKSQGELDTLDQRVEHAKAALARASEGAAAWKDRVQAHTSLVTERKVRLAQVTEQLDGTNTTLERLAVSIADHEDRVRRLEQDAVDAAIASGETAALMVAARERRLEADEIAQKVHQDHDEARRLLEEIRFALAERETALRTLRADLTSAEERAKEHELKLQKLELAREHLLEGVRERFRGLDLHRIVGKYHARPTVDAEHRRRIDELSKLIERMGPVNLDAKVEFDDAEKRFVELSGQKEDIDKALLDLERAIKHMNRESRRKFKETFEAVNDLFRKTFHEMFRGGRAELHLTNPEDLLESGVEVVAQPPGKKLGNIELMSGGEKALTATALIFAIFRHRPSPFCVLDEVDAPLDEANVRRYNEAIRSMTDRSQFILITHIKSTMQSVDVLYGVTMGEPGVSRIVSVKVNDAAPSRSERRNVLEEQAEPPKASVASVA